MAQKAAKRHTHTERLLNIEFLNIEIIKHKSFHLIDIPESDNTEII